jgi:hypothetical protein
MMCRRLKTLACAAALAVTSCRAAPAAAPAATAGPGLQGDRSARAVDPSKVKGRLAPEIIQRVVRDNFAGMRTCYEEGLRRDPALKGKITTKFVIGLDGTVSAAADVHDAASSERPDLPVDALRDVDGRREAQDPRFPDPEVTACVVARFKALKFPQPQGGIVTVVYPVIFQPGE